MRALYYYFIPSPKSKPKRQFIFLSWISLVERMEVVGKLALSQQIEICESAGLRDVLMFVVVMMMMMTYQKEFAFRCFFPTHTHNITLHCIRHIFLFQYISSQAVPQQQENVLKKDR